MLLPSLIRASTLHSSLASPSISKKIKLLDGSWHLPLQARDPYAEFMQHHIPDSRFFGIETIKDEDSNLPHMLPSPTQFSKAMDGFEITKDHHVVVYDACNGLRSACRVWWTFRVFGHDNVSVLDGGLASWRAAGYPVVSSQQMETKSSISLYNPVSFRNEMVKKMEDIQKNLSTHEFQVVDARPFGRFSGKDPEPRQGVASGHIPNSVNIPASTLLDNQGYFKPVPTLKAIFESKLDLEKPIICTCGSGITATMVVFALKIIGIDNAAVYDGSWVEWCTRGGKVATGTTI
ncbi:hypothetical protein HMI54_007755 [Coelomomyces lativittatus]|nr:hypothetical protein HMI55_002902 [Coelomomyces lativittatus]KAJ1503825.1 hypothetical protein HMI54_007755 [Coelomomyces lativittatus]KAJ1504282.1 hypothetical protein HMI56_001701 [Coelomomyces lativittatus]